MVLGRLNLVLVFSKRRQDSKISKDLGWGYFSNEPGKQFH